MANPVKQQMTAQYLQTKRRRQGAGEHKPKRKPTALRHLLWSKRAKAQHVQRDVLRSQAAGQSEKPGNARKSTAATYQKSTYRQTRCVRRERENAARSRHAAIRPRFATSKTRGCYLMRAPAIARQLPADRGERGARRRDRASTWHCIGALGVLDETRKEI